MFDLSRMAQTENENLPWMPERIRRTASPPGKHPKRSKTTLAFAPIIPKWNLVLTQNSWSNVADARFGITESMSLKTKFLKQLMLIIFRDYRCIKVSEIQAEAYDKFHCKNCIPTLGPSTSKLWRKNWFFYHVCQRISCNASECENFQSQSLERQSFRLSFFNWLWFFRVVLFWLFGFGWLVEFSYFWFALISNFRAIFRCWISSYIRRFRKAAHKQTPSQCLRHQQKSG